MASATRISVPAVSSVALAKEDRGIRKDRQVCRIPPCGTGMPARRLSAQRQRTTSQITTVDFRDSGDNVARIRFPEFAEGFGQARQAWAECGCATRSIGLVSMRAEQTRRRPKIAAAFPEPSSRHIDQAQVHFANITRNRRFTSWIARPRPRRGARPTDSATLLKLP